MTDSSEEPYSTGLVWQPSEWMQEAACSNRPLEWFELPDQMTSAKIKNIRLDLLRGQAVCSGCPVAAQCLEQSTVEDRHWTIRGGEWPTGLSQRPVGRPAGVRISRRTGEPTRAVYERQGMGPASFASGPCKRGHDRMITGLTAKGRCYQCKRDYDYSVAHPEAPRALLRPVWEYMDVCPQGHDLGPVEDRLGPSCPTCRIEGERENRKRTRERINNDPVRKARDLENRRRNLNASRARKRAAARAA